MLGRQLGAVGSGQVEQEHGVVVGSAEFGGVDAHAVAGGAFEGRALEAEGDSAYLGVRPAGWGLV
ncbi:hypothetical protein A6A29_08920 [Streptomyces sp. TSRI0281]|nr:hypothetical protein A6A29_08920 [Streptomyces sp. TSRI0281]